MSLELIIVVVLIVVGGGTAFFADWLGLTMGKKRLTLFKMRPRNTARVVTVISGVVIAGLTFLMLILLNRDFRVAVRQGAQVIHRNYVLRGQNTELQRQARSAQTAAQAAQQQALTEDQRRVEAEGRLASVNQQLTVAQTLLTQARQQMAVVQGQLTHETAELGAARTALASAKNQSVVLEARNAQVQKRLSVEEQFAKPRISKKDQGELVYRYGAEIGRVVIAAGQPIPIIQQQINSFLTSLSGDAREHGASVGANGRAVEVATVAISTRNGTKTDSSPPTFAGEQTNVAALAGQIHAYQGGGSVVVIAKTTGNSFAGEQVYVRLSPFANLLVIPKGTVLGTLRIPDAENDPSKILAQIQKSLILQVHAAAVHAGVIPVVNPQLHEAQLGGVTLVDLYKVVDQVRHISGDTVITVSAAQDTYSADQLHLAFGVASASQAGR